MRIKVDMACRIEHPDYPLYELLYTLQDLENDLQKHVRAESAGNAKYPIILGVHNDDARAVLRITEILD